MEIIFGQCFDRGYYLNYAMPENQNIFNKLLVGPLGLLNLLERELGLSGSYLSIMERKIVYRKILGEFLLQNPSAFFAKSFEIDPGGVSVELLKYRDQLVLSGWNKNFGDVSVKVDCIRDIERKREMKPGIEDRWYRIYEVLKSTSKVEMQLSSMVLTEKQELLHPYFGKLFELLKDKGIGIITSSEEPINDNYGNLGKIRDLISGQKDKCEFSNQDIKSFQIMHFNNDQEAAEFIASQNGLLKDATIINSINNNFDDLQSAFGLPVSGSDFNNANPHTIQLFKLSSALFFKPLNIQNLLSYFQITVHPIPGKLRMNLLRLISEEGGVENDKWKKVIDEYGFESEKKKSEILNFLKIRDYKTNEIDKHDLLQFYNSMIDWARKRRIAVIDEDPNMAGQLLHLRDLCKRLLTLIEDMSSDKLNTKEFIQAIKETYEPMVISGTQTQKGSVPVVSSAGQIYSRVDTLVWMDFYNSGIKPQYYSFLNNREIQKLTEHGALLWDSASQTQSKMQQFKNAVLKTDKRCIFITCDKIKDEGTSEHPLHSFLKANIKNLNEYVINYEELLYSQKFTDYGFEKPDLIEINHQILPQKQSEIKISNGELISKRTVESVSSIESIIQFPFDWVLQYAANIRPSNSYQLADITITLGNVAHKFIEQIFTDANFNINRAKILFEDFETRITKCIEERGAILLLDEHRFERERFVSLLKKSTINLINLLSENHLIIEGIEYKTEGTAGILDDQDFIGYIDLLLKDVNDKHVIFDLKWTLSDKKYQKKVREGRSIQLSIYNALLRNNKKAGISKTAYYLLSSGKLISGYDFTGEDLIKIESKLSEEEILEKVENSVVYRREQFKDGIIEEGEEGDLNDLSYYNKQEKEGLMELETDSTNKKKKKNYYSSYDVLKGNIN